MPSYASGLGTFAGRWGGYTATLNPCFRVDNQRVFCDFDASNNGAAEATWSKRRQSTGPHKAFLLAADETRMPDAYVSPGDPARLMVEYVNVAGFQRSHRPSRPGRAQPDPPDSRAVPAWRELATRSSFLVTLCYPSCGLKESPGWPAARCTYAGLPARFQALSETMAKRAFAVLAVLPPLIGSLVITHRANGSRATSGVRFTDITNSSGIHFTHTSAPEKKYIVESMSGGVALFDYDNDGCLDIYFTNSLTVDTAGDPTRSPSALYRGHCDGTFTDVTRGSGLEYPGWAMGVVAADFDGDGYEDLYVTCLGHNHLYHNNGNGSFTDVTERAGVDDPRWSTGAAFGDYDRDGVLDLFVANYVDFKLSDLPAFGKGKFCIYQGVPVQCGPRGLPGASDSLFHNNGNGTFTDVSQKAGASDPDHRYGLGAVWTDVDGDGWPDLYVANDAGPNYLYHNNRDGTFTEIGYPAGVAVNEDGQPQGSMGIAVGDYLHTGLLAFFVTNFSQEYHILYRHDAPLAFSDASFQAGTARVPGVWVGWGTAFFDYDNDGWPDLMAVSGHVYPQLSNYTQRILLFHNQHDGTFSEVAAESGEALMVPRVSRGAAFGDIDNDGDIDVVVENLDGTPTILRNDGGNRNHWITIKLVGHGLNRDAIGARVKAVAGDLVQWDEVRTGGSYLSSSDLRLHFGLGASTQVDLIEVHWPDGRLESVRGVVANQFVTVAEGRGIIQRTPPRNSASGR